MYSLAIGSTLKYSNPKVNSTSERLVKSSTRFKSDKLHIICVGLFHSVKIWQRVEGVQIIVIYIRFEVML